MLARLWALRLVIALLAAGYGVLLPAHHHGGAHAAHGPSGASGCVAAHVGGDDHADAPDHGGHDHLAVAGHEPGDTEHHDPHEDDGEHAEGHCGICHAVRTLYTPVAAPLPVLAPQAATTAVSAGDDVVLSVRPRPTYHGRAPPSCR